MKSITLGIRAAFTVEPISPNGRQIRAQTDPAFAAAESA